MSVFYGLVQYLQSGFFISAVSLCHRLPDVFKTDVPPGQGICFCTEIKEYRKTDKKRGTLARTSQDIDLGQQITIQR